ncbi:MAG TPA: hypothetical protein VFW97_18695 [Acidimicrobiia bacterium]|nr:hypothetical protein [Acidimicrobiia bacterium]
MTFAARSRGLLLAVALVALLVGGAAPVAHADVSAQGCTSRAVVVVEPGPGAVSICFDGAISGLDALQLAGANPVTYGFAGQGAAVCQLYGVGNPADSSCLVGSGGQYWAYYRAAPGAGGWTYSRAGASTTTVTDGSVEGWRYGTGGAPGFVSFCAVVGCGPAPTDPPPVTQAPPPVTAAPPVATAPATGGPGTAPASSSAKDSAKSDTKDSGKAADATSADHGTAADRGSATSTTGKDGRTAAAHHDRTDRSGTVELAAGGHGGGGDGGSPIGVIVALAVVAAGVGGGLWLRRRRRGPAPG